MEIGALQFVNDKDKRVTFWTQKGIFLCGEDFDSLKNLEILFIHSTDFIKLRTNQKQQILNFKGWKIRYSGDPVDNALVAVNLDLKEANNLSWDMITLGFDRFISNLKSDNIIQAIYELIGYDPKFENLLKPFETVSPFVSSNEIVTTKIDGCEESKTVFEAQRHLNIHVKEILAKQSS